MNCINIIPFPAFPCQGKTVWYSLTAFLPGNLRSAAPGRRLAARNPCAVVGHPIGQHCCRNSKSRYNGPVSRNVTAILYWRGTKQHAGRNHHRVRLRGPYSRHLCREGESKSSGHRRTGGWGAIVAHDPGGEFPRIPGGYPGTGADRTDEGTGGPFWNRIQGGGCYGSRSIETPLHPDGGRRTDTDSNFDHRFRRLRPLAGAGR